MVFHYHSRQEPEYHFWGLGRNCSRSVRRCFQLESREIQDLGVCDAGGIKISRRPNSRASNENTPGPSKAIAMDITISSKDAAFPTNGRFAAIGSQENAFARVTIVIRTLATGVRNPIKRSAPHTASAMQATRPPVRLPSFERQIKPCAEAMAPTTTRINSSAVPGLPPGNVENSLCSDVLPINSQSTTI